MAETTDELQDPRAIILASPMSPHQTLAVVVTIALCALDGFDVLAITFAAPGIVKEWGLGPAALGVVFSMGLLGMAAGSLLISPIADLIGRRKVIFLSLAVMAVATFLTATAHNVTSLAIWRLITGLGIGAMISTIYPLAAEYANARRRDLAVSLTATGYAIGAVLGGLVVAMLLKHFDWRSIFIFGGLAAVVMAPIVYFFLPESVPYIIARDQPNALARVNAFLRRSRLPTVATLPPRLEQPAAPVGTIFAPDMVRLTLQITLINLLYVLSVYYMLSWIPQTVAKLGFTPSEAAGVSVAANLGGIVGGMLLGYAADRLGLKRLVLVAFLGMAVATAMFGRTPADLGWLTLVAAVGGFFMFGGMIGLYAVIARTFPAGARATGTGFVVGVGRASSAAAPVIAGLLLAAGFGRDSVSLVMAIPALLAAIVLLAFPVRPVSAAV